MEGKNQLDNLLNAVKKIQNVNTSNLSQQSNNTTSQSNIKTPQR